MNPALRAMDPAGSILCQQQRLGQQPATKSLFPPPTVPSTSSPPKTKNCPKSGTCFRCCNAALAFITLVSVGRWRVQWEKSNGRPCLGS